MRRQFALGLGLTGLLAGSAAAQFGSPPAGPTSPNPAPFGGATGATSASKPSGPIVATPTAPPRLPMPNGYVRPVAGFTAAAPTPGATRLKIEIPPVEIPLALGANHPMAVKAEDGEYFICVKSYSRPHDPGPAERGFNVKQLSEALAAEIQQTHGCRVLLYELISEEKKASAKAKTEALRRRAEFESAVQKYRQRGELLGADSVYFDSKLKYRTFKCHDQVAVLVGGFRTEDEAVKALAAIKKWPPPRDERLMDIGSLATRQKNGLSQIERKYFNPYPQAMVVRNPTTRRTMQAAKTIDPFLIKLNANNPYSLLNTTKKWTLAVKSFSSPVHIASQDQKFSLKRRAGFAKDSEVLQAGASQAEVLAKALRQMKGRGGEPLGIEAFVLHTRYASLVYVGQWDSPNDPELLDKQRILSNMSFNLSRDSRGSQITGQKKLFGDRIVAVPIPPH